MALEFDCAFNYNIAHIGVTPSVGNRTHCHYWSLNHMSWCIGKTQLGVQFYTETATEMAKAQFVEGSPLRTLCLLLAGQPADVFSGTSLPGAKHTMDTTGSSNNLSQVCMSLIIAAAAVFFYYYLSFFCGDSFFSPGAKTSCTLVITFHKNRTHCHVNFQNAFVESSLLSYICVYVCMDVCM
jgi:hypothetical protein